MTPDKPKARDWQKLFQLEDFEVLRVTLAEHLKDVIPEKERDKIFNLIHDVKWCAKERANAILREELATAKRVYGDKTKHRGWWDGHQQDTDTHKALLIDEREI